MTWISLKGMKFKAPVGVYEEEKLNKNDIEIDVSVKVNTRKANSSDDLNETVDYQSLFDISKKVVLQVSNLLESISERIISQILEEHPPVKRVKIKVRKLNPPIEGECSFSEVSMKGKR